MAKMLQVFKCEKCGNIVEVLHAGTCDPSCCDQTMKLLVENTVDAAKEKHVPVVEKVQGGFRVKVGAVAHPMTEEHRIEWIELLADGISYRKFLKAGDPPEAFFAVDAVKVTVREYCNLHGHWSA